MSALLVYEDELHIGCIAGRVELYDFPRDSPDGPVHLESFEYAGPVRGLRVRSGKVVASPFSLPDAEQPQPLPGTGLFVGGISLTSLGALMMVPGLVALPFALGGDVVFITPLIIGGAGTLVTAGGAVMLHYGIERRRTHRLWREQQSLVWAPVLGRTARRTATFGAALRF